MSWISKLTETQLEIKTGDGKTYKPLWKEAKKNLNFNTEGYDFIDKNGTYVERKKASGNQYPILLWFQGENHLSIASAFETSALDNRPWTLRHPFYGELTVQPLSLEFDNSDYNVTRITGTVWETTLEKLPSGSSDPTSTISAMKADVDAVNAANFDNLIVPKAADIQPASLSVKQISRNFKGLGAAEDLQNLTRQASGAALQIITYPNAYILSVQDLINFPFQTAATIKTKLKALYKSIVELATIIDNILFDGQASTIVTEACRACVFGKYDNRTEVVETINAMTSIYNYMLTNFEGKGYVQNAELAIGLDVIVNTTLDSLNSIAFESKQERTYTLEKDENVVVLAHRFVDSGDDALETFLGWNDFSVGEYLEIKKGRKIRYYR